MFWTLHVCLILIYIFFRNTLRSDPAKTGGTHQLLVCADNVNLLKDNIGLFSIYVSTALVDLGSLFQFPNPSTVGRTPWTNDQPVARSLPACRTTQTQNKHTQTSMLRVGFELMP
jgi:hypothetical protein